MATKPTNLGLWAENEVTETIEDTTFVNKVAPPQGYIDQGVLALEPWSRAFLNFQLNVAGKWHEWLDQALYPIGFVYITSDATDPNTVLGIGTWNNYYTDIGSPADGTKAGTSTGNLYYWERTA